MTLFGKLICEGDTVVEIGGHIGYISLYFANLVGESGKVIVFEPGTNNLPYLLENTSGQSNITVVPKAVGDTEGQAHFYIEELTGQNNTLMADFDGLSANAQSAHIETEYKDILVDIVTLDKFLPQAVNRVDFIKIDVEGAELRVLEGARAAITSYKPKIMVECNDTGHQLFDYLNAFGFVILTPEGNVIETWDQMRGELLWVSF